MSVLRRGRGAASRGVGIVAAGLALSLGMTSTAYGAISSGAYGASVNVTTLGLLNVNVGPLPTVTLPATGSVTPITATLATVSVPGLLSLGVTNVSTQGTPGGGTVTSSSDTANVAVPTVLSADAIHSSCTASSAAGASGTTTTVNLVVGGITVAANPGPNTTLSVAGIATVIINEQIPSGTASSPEITVNAIHVKLLPGLTGLGTGDIIVGQSRCSAAPGVVLPVGAIGGVLLTGVLGVLFTGYQLNRRRSNTTNAAV